VSRLSLRLNPSWLVFNDLPRGKEPLATKPGEVFGLWPRRDRTTMFQLTRRSAPSGGDLAVWSAYQAAACSFIVQLHGWADVGFNSARVRYVRA
jgi:hypothetical protein